MISNKIKVILRGSVIREPNQIRTVVVPQDELRAAWYKDNADHHVAELAFKYGQNDFQPQENLRSVSVGDVVILGKDKFGVVAMSGFYMTNKKVLREYMKNAPLGSNLWGEPDGEAEYAIWAHESGRPVLKRDYKDTNPRGEKKRALLSRWMREEFEPNKGDYSKITPYDRYAFKQMQLDMSITPLKHGRTIRVKAVVAPSKKKIYKTGPSISQIRRK